MKQRYFLLTFSLTTGGTDKVGVICPLDFFNNKKHFNGDRRRVKFGFVIPSSCQLMP